MSPMSLGTAAGNGPQVLSERFASRPGWGFQRLRSAAAVQFAQPNIAYGGAMSQALKIGTVAAL